MSKTMKKILFAPIAVALSLVLLVLSYAYFTSNTERDFNASINVELLFDRLNNDALLKYQQQIWAEKDEIYEKNFGAEGDGSNREYTFTYTNSNGEEVTLTDAPTAETGVMNVQWGSEYNPYIISDKRHLQNLSTLTNNGYFETVFDYLNLADDGVTYTNPEDVPFFMISTPDGEVTCIDAEGVTIAPIGNETRPFVGSVRGLIDGMKTADGSTTVPNGSTATSSVIHGVKVVGSGVHDVGLFGLVAYTGNEDETTEDLFEGVPSVIEGFVLSDIQIVAEYSAISDLSAWLSSRLSPMIAEKTTGTDGYVTHPETHHVGILAGHIEYGRVNHISIYYSQDNICALDVSALEGAGDGYTNYASVTGILGNLHSMNPTTVVKVQGDDEASFIVAGDGISNSSISQSGTTTGGGGKLHGTWPGYVLASEVYSLYHSNKKDTEKVLELADAKQIVIKEGVVTYGDNLCSTYTSQVGGSTYYFFTDGVFTLGLSQAQATDYIQEIWPTEEWDGNPVDTTDTITLGSNDPDDWKAGQRGDYAYFAYFRPLSGTTMENGKQYVLVVNKRGNNTLTENQKVFAKFGNGLEAVSAADMPPRTTTSDGQYRYKLAQRNDFNGMIFTYNNKQLMLNASSKLGLYYERYLWGLSESESIYIGNASSSSGSWGTSYTYYYEWSFGGSNNNISAPAALKNDGRTRYLTLSNLNSGTSFGITSSVSTSSTNANGDTVYDINNNLVQFEIYEYVGTFFEESTLEEDLSDAVVLVPEEDPAFELPADEYVLWPNQIYHAQNNSSTQNGNGAAASFTTDTNPVLKNTLGKYYQHYTSNRRMINNYGFNNNVDGNAVLTYDLVKISDLYDMNNKWNYANGEAIDTIDYAFALTTGINVGQKLGLFGWSIDFDGVMRAPVGNATNVPVPAGSLALRVNAASEDNPATVRLILVVTPQSGTNTYGFGVWKNSLSESSSSWISFDQLDMKSPYMGVNFPISIANDNNTENYTLVNYGGTTYRSYLNGDQVLVACEFKLTEIGNYILGATNGPMTIAYFSVDGAASEGNDGTGGNQIGSIDFVYANASNQILTVDKLDPNLADIVGTENENTATYYYPSYTFVYFNNQSHSDQRIWGEKFYVRRWLDSGGQRGITVNVYTPQNLDADAGEVHIPYTIVTHYVTGKSDGWADEEDLRLGSYYPRTE